MISNDPYKDNMYVGTAQKIKGEVKKGIFWYVISTIISKVFAYTVGGVIMLAILIANKIFLIFLSEEERAENRERNESVAVAHQEHEAIESKARLIAELKEITGA